jgi:hypothetical protein
MLCGVEALVLRIDGNTVGIADAGGVAFRRGEFLPGLVRVVAPDAAARFELLAGLEARRLRHAVFLLTGIGGRRDIDEHLAFVVDGEGVHGMVAGERQPRDDGLGRIGGHRTGLRQPVAHDAVVYLGIERAAIDRDAGPAGRALRRRVAEAADHIGFAVPVGIFQGNQKSARRGFVVAVIETAPRVDVDDAVAADSHVPGVTQLVGKDGGAEPRRQGNPRIRSWAAHSVTLGRGLAVRRSTGRRASASQQDGEADG